MSKDDWQVTNKGNITLDGINFGGFKPGDSIQVSNTSDSNGIYTIKSGSSTTITLEDPYQEQIDDLNRKFDKIMDRLAIIDDPDPEQLEKNRSLKKAYEKYKMLEALAGVKDE